MGWKEWAIDAFEIFGPASLAVVSFTEAIIQPLPPDILYLPMLVDVMGDTPAVVWLWLVVTISSVLGSIVGYWIGGRWGDPLMQRFAKPEHISKLKLLSEKYGTVGIFIAAFSPIPYKVFGWIAGMTEMDRTSFIAAGLAGRGLRFGVEALLIGLYGQQALNALFWFLDNEILLAIALIAMTIVAWFLWTWWNELGEENPSPE
ncbi:MAG: VTT domain-containing protein [Candidatus Poseidoniaceae archaeon]|nr:VTT domain-containing protein [Candidatus Poseidoniaceae archaeon]